MKQKISLSLFTIQLAFSYYNDMCDATTRAYEVMASTSNDTRISKSAANNMLEGKLPLSRDAIVHECVEKINTCIEMGFIADKYTWALRNGKPINLFAFFNELMTPYCTKIYAKADSLRVNNVPI